MTKLAKGREIGTGMSVDHVALADEKPDTFLAVKITGRGQSVVMRDKDPARLANRLRRAGIEAVITTAGRNVGTIVF